MHILWSTLDFASKGLVVFVVFLACSIAVFLLFFRRRRAEGVIRIRKLNHQLKRTIEIVGRAVLGGKELRQLRKQTRERRQQKGPRPKVFVLDFRGDMAASGVQSLRQEITAVLQVVKNRDEVVVRLESPGGMVPHYGLAASQLARLKGKVHLTVCIDKMAASGGYLMACVADEILAAPFAIVGSIGVAAQVPNVHRWLQEHGVDYEDMTAGEYKRTVSFLGKITEEGRKKFQEQIDETHGLFKSFVKEYRPKLDIDALATGEFWHGTRALELELVDRLVASDDYILEKLESSHVYALSVWTPRTWRERVASTASLAAEKLLLRLWTRGESIRFQ